MRGRRVVDKKVEGGGEGGRKMRGRKVEGG